MDEITIGRRTDAEADEVLELLATVFDDTSRAWFEAVCDPPYPESAGFVARAGRRIVSHVEVLDMPLRYGDVILHTGAISGVATLPAWRGRGLASALMERAMAEMAAREMPLSILLTGSQAFYERLGWCDWMPPGRTMTWPSPPAPLPALGEEAEYSVAPYQPKDLAEMMALYERYSAGRPGTLLRPERYWRSVMLRWLEATEYPGQRNAVVVARREGRLVGYCFAYTDEDAFVISEAAYEEEGAVAPLLAALIKRVGEPLPRRLVAVLPWDSAMLKLMEAMGQTTPNESLGIMWRINDLAGLLQRVRPVLQGRLRPSPPAPLPTWGEGGVILAYERGEAALKASEGRLEIGEAGDDEGRPYLRLRQTDLVNLLLGSYPSTAWLDELGAPGEARPLLERLFPPAGGLFWLTDNF